MSKFIMVLQDGETYSGLAGCAIVAIPEDAEPDEIENFLASSQVADDDNGFLVITVFEEMA